MPAPPLKSSLDGPVGSTISTANSGGSVGDAFTGVTVGTGVTMTYSSTQTHFGSAAMQITQPATSAITYADWSGLGIAENADLWHRFYLWLPANPAGDSRIAESLTQTGGLSGRIVVLAGGTGLASINAAGVKPAGGGGTTAIPLQQWVRIEWRVRPSTTIGQIEWRLYTSPESSTITETTSITGQALGVDLGTMRTGFSGANAVASNSTYWDDIAVSSVTWPGPAAAAAGAEPAQIAYKPMTAGRV